MRLAGAKGSHHFEVRCVDGTSNPYLALAAIIAAGTKGIVDDALLQSGDCATPVALMSEEQRKAAGVENATRLPRSIEEARQNLQEDLVLMNAFGEQFVKEYVDVNKVNHEFNSGEASSRTLISFRCSSLESVSCLRTRTPRRRSSSISIRASILNV